MDKPFWQNLDRYGRNLCLIEPITERSLNFREVAQVVARGADKLYSSEKKLILCPLNNRLEDICRYLSVLASGHVACLYSKHTSIAGMRNIIRTYKPDIIFGSAVSEHSVSTTSGQLREFEGEQVYFSSATQKPIHNLLTLLISTSGSSGSAKLVRLSTSNLCANASQISQALSLNSAERAITSVPISFIYGLSILHSHLEVGASLVVDGRSIIEQSFWRSISEHKVTSFAGGPWTYQTIKKMGLTSALTEITRFTTSGAKVDAVTANWMRTELGSGDIYFMYGQTEAAGRMSVLPAELVDERFGSVGRAVPQGSFELQNDGSITFYGPNVMLGYSHTPDDLILGDILQGRLDTGDLGALDNGFLYISGRRGRISKLFGLRLSLDEIEKCLLEAGLNCRVFQDVENAINVRHETGREFHQEKCVSILEERFSIPRYCVKFEFVEVEPTTSSWKWQL